MAGDAVRHDVAQEARGAKRIEFQNVVGGAFVARLVKDGAGEVDVEEEKLTGGVDAEIQAGVAFAFEADEDLGGGAAERRVERGVGHRDIALGVVLGDFEVVGFEANAGGEKELDGLEDEGIKAIARLRGNKDRELAPGNELLDQGLLEPGAHGARLLAEGGFGGHKRGRVDTEAVAGVRGFDEHGKAEAAQGVVAVVENERREGDAAGMGDVLHKLLRRVVEADARTGVR